MSYVVLVKSKVKISENFVAFSEYMNFTKEEAKIKRSLLMLTKKNRARGRFEIRRGGGRAVMSSLIGL